MDGEPHNWISPEVMELAERLRRVRHLETLDELMEALIEEEWERRRRPRILEREEHG